MPDQFHAELDDLIASAQRGAELTRNLLGFARRGQYRRDRVDLRALINDMVRMLSRTVPKGVTFDTRFDELQPATTGDPALLTQALINLCVNAVDSMRGVGRLTIAVGRVELDTTRAAAIEVHDGEFVTIAVTDTGAGMAPETVKRIFEPFFTTKEVGRGTGLGLAMVHGTIKSSGGAIAVDSIVGAGTTFTLYLPAAATRRDSAKFTVRAAVAPPGSGLVLVVDDDERIRKVARRILESHGYTVCEAVDGADGVAVFDQRRDEIRLVVLDMAMPVMNGADCFRAIRARDPGARVLLASGYTIEEDARRCLADGALGFIDKPYSVDRFATAVAAAISAEGADHQASG